MLKRFSKLRGTPLNELKLTKNRNSYIDLCFLQVLESVPTISVEKTDGCQMYLSKGNNPEIITAKSSEMNVIIPTDDDDYVSYFCLG